MAEGASPVPTQQRDELWAGTRARLNKPADPPQRYYGRGLPELLAEREAEFERLTGHSPYVTVDLSGVHVDRVTGASWWWAPDGRMFYTHDASRPIRIVGTTPTSITITEAAPAADATPEPLRNGLRRPRGYRERPRWQDRRQGRARPWE